MAALGDERHRLPRREPAAARAGGDFAMARLVAFENARSVVGSAGICSASVVCCICGVDNGAEEHAVAGVIPIKYSLVSALRFRIARPATCEESEDMVCAFAVGLPAGAPEQDLGGVAAFRVVVVRLVGARTGKPSVKGRG